MTQLNEQFKRMQLLAGIITEAVDKALDTKVGLLLKDPNVKTSIDSLIKDMPAEPKGSTMTKLPDDKMHITLTSIKSFKPFKDKLKDFQLPEDIKFPNVELGNAEFVYREDGKTTYVAAVKNQNDIKEFVDKIYQKIGETNPEPNRFFHITLANNQGGDPFKSIGNVEKSDLIKENENSSLHFFFDLDGVLADMEKGLQQSPEIIALRKILDDLISNNFPEFKNLVDDKIKEKIKADLPPDAPANHPLKPLKKAFNNYTSKVFSVASKEGFYKNLPLMPGAKEMLKKAQEISGKKPDILSSPVQGENTSVQEKKDWVNTNFGDLVDKIIIDTDKGKYAKSKNDVLIDDRPKYVSVFESAGGSAILHKNYNDTIKEMEKFKQSLTENKMKKSLNEQFKRMQRLAGIITESTAPNTPPGATAGTALDEVLDNLKDAQTTVTWIKTQLDEYIDGISDYGAGYKVEEKLEKILKLVATKFKISEDSFKIEDKSNTSYNSYDEGTVNGEIKLNGQSIVKYSSHDDGYGFSGEVNENALKAELEKLIKPITESIEKIVDKALRKHRRMLNENEDIKEKVYNYLNSNEIMQFTGVTSFKTCDEDDWEKVKKYIEGNPNNRFSSSGKQGFLANNEDVTEQDFDKYYDEWLDYIEDERNMESRNQQDFNF